MIFVLLSLLTILLINTTKGNTHSYMPSVFLLTCYAIVFSLRAMDVADTEPYYDLYTGIVDPNMEVGYLAVNYFMASNGVPFNIFLLMIATFDILLWFICVKKILYQNSILVAVLVFMSNMGIIYYGIVLRSGMASSIMFLPLSFLIVSYEDNITPHVNKKLFLNILFFLFFLFLAGLFHQSIYILIVALFLYFVPLNNRIRYVILILGMIVSATPALSSLLTSHIQPFLYENDLRMADRFNREIQTGISINQIINVIYGFIYLRFIPLLKIGSEQRKYKFILDLYCVGVLVSGLFSFLIAGSRLGHLLMFYDFLIPAILIKELKRGYYRKKVFIVFLLIICLNYVRIFTSTPSLLNYIK